MPRHIRWNIAPGLYLVTDGGLRLNNVHALLHFAFSANHSFAKEPQESPDGSAE